MTTSISPPWSALAWIERTQCLLDSFARLLSRELISRNGAAVEQAQRLFEADFVVVAHGTQDDPILNYANSAALRLWEVDLATLLQTPSRLTAEPVHRDERAQMLERTRRVGFIDDYRGVRISATGRRFLIERAIVWNLQDATGQPSGQAATFADWQELPRFEDRL